MTTEPAPSPEHPRHGDAGPVAPIVIAHREADPGPPKKWGAWYLHAVYPSVDAIEPPDFEADQWVAFDALGRELDYSVNDTMIDVTLTVSDDDPSHAVDLELLMRRHLRQSDDARARDASLSLQQLVEASYVPYSTATNILGFVAPALVALVLVGPWLAGIAALIHWATT